MSVNRKKVSGHYSNGSQRLCKVTGDVKTLYFDSSPLAEAGDARGSMQKAEAAFLDAADIPGPADMECTAVEGSQRRKLRPSVW